MKHLCIEKPSETMKSVKKREKRENRENRRKTGKNRENRGKFGHIGGIIHHHDNFIFCIRSGSNHISYYIEMTKPVKNPGKIRFLLPQMKFIYYDMLAGCSYDTQKN